MNKEEKRWLPIPVGVNSTEGMFVGWIPFPMSEEDYELMMETLALWKPMLTRPSDWTKEFEELCKIQSKRLLEQDREINRLLSNAQPAPQPAGEASTTEGVQ